MTPAVQQFLSVFLATLPLVGVIGWAAFQQNSRFDMLGGSLNKRMDMLDKRIDMLGDSINHRMDRLEKRLDDLGEDLKSLGVRVNDHDVRIAKVETRLDNPRLVTK